MEPLSTPLKAPIMAHHITCGQKGNMRTSTVLGAGSSSVVYLVDQQQVEKRFKSLDDLLNEQTIYESLGSHRRLIPIHSVGPDRIVLDWMENGDLARFIKSHPEVSRRHKYQWIEQIAQCFSLLHAHHISHCDSKLENFLVDKEYDIRICDFASSHNYRAPSQDPAIQPPRYRRVVDDFDEATFNPADDIFAFGSICYQIITGGPVYPQLDDDSLSHHFAQHVFPATEGLPFGPIISGCWMSTFTSFDTILSAIEREQDAKVMN